MQINCLFVQHWNAKENISFAKDETIFVAHGFGYTSLWMIVFDKNGDTHKHPSRVHNLLERMFTIETIEFIRHAHGAKETIIRHIHTAQCTVT